MCSEAADIARSEMDDLDRLFDDDAGADLEHEAVGEERGVERGEGLVGIVRQRFERGCDQLGRSADRRRRRAEPNAGRQPVDG